MLTAEDRAESADLLSQLVSALQERAWPGDDVLVEQLRDRLAAVPHLDLDQLASVLDGPEGGLLDLQDGGVLPADYAEQAGLDLDDEHTVHVPGLGSGAAWRDRWSFVETLPEGPGRERLATALQGRGAFRRFALELDRHEELVAPFLAWADDRAAGRAREWLHDEGLLDLP